MQKVWMWFQATKKILKILLGQLRRVMTGLLGCGACMRKERKPQSSDLFNSVVLDKVSGWLSFESGEKQTLGHT